MVKTKEHIIAKLLTDLYKGLEPSKMTDAEKNIWLILKELENRRVKSGSSGWNFDEIDFFRKLIKQHEKVFLEATSVNTNPERAIPKPTFNTNDYSIEDQVLFWKVYIENLYAEDDKENQDTKRPNRKSNYNFNKKIDIDQNYDFVMQLLQELKPDTTYPNLNYSPETNLYHKYRDKTVKTSILFAGHYHEGLVVDNKAIFNDEYIQGIWDSWSNIHNYNTIYILSLLDLWIYLKEPLISDVFTDSNFGMAQKKYYVRWNLWIYVIMQNFQYLFKHGLITKSDVLDIINEIQEIGTEIQCQKDLRDKPDIADAYFNYNYLLKIRTGCLEEIHFGCMKSNAYTSVKSDDLDLEKNDIYTNYSYTELSAKFNSGVDTVCNIKTFKRRLEFCKKFAEEYRKLAGRNWNPNHTKVLRAIYTVLYINPCKYNRMTSATMARKILKDDERSLSQHYLLGMSISRELQLSESNGNEFAKEKMKFMKEFYVLALDIINNSLPTVSAPVECLNALLDDLDEKMKKILKILYAKIKQPTY